MNQFNYLSKSILQNMNSLEKELGGEKMFHEILPEFNDNFWLAHDAGDTRSMLRLHNVLCKIIDDVRSGDSFAIERIRA